MRYLFVMAVMASLLTACLSDSSEKGPGGSDGLDTTGTDTVRCSEAACGPFALRAAYWPIAIGNSWTYVDSTFGDKGQLVLVDTFDLVVQNFGVDSVSQDVWWQTHSDGIIAFPQTMPGHLALMQRGDTIFGREHSFWENTWFTVAKLIPIPASEDSIRYLGVHGGDVGYTIRGIRNPSGYATPAGFFTGSVSYSFPINYHRALEFKAGVGILGYEIGGNPGVPPKSAHRGRLLKYSLKP